MMSEPLPLVIIGAGPAGLAAASVAGELGIDTLLLDEQNAPGGQVYRGVQQAGDGLFKALGEGYRRGRSLLAGLQHPSVRYLPGATVWQLSDPARVCFVAAAGAQSIQAGRVILATGALERPMPMPGWTLPGVMAAGGVQNALKSAGMIPAGRLILAGSGPLLYLLACQLHDAGKPVAALVETSPRANALAAIRHLPGMIRGHRLLAEGLGLLRGLRQRGVPHYRNAVNLRARGDTRVKSLMFETAGKAMALQCDLLALHQGVVPNIQLSRQLRLGHDWHESARCWYPRLDVNGMSTLPWLYIAGDGGGIHGAVAAVHQGRIAAFSAALDLGAVAQDRARSEIADQQRRLRGLRAARGFVDRMFTPSPEFLQPADDTIVCRCEEVSAGQIREYVRLGCVGPNQAKAFGRPGMGPCQGRYCGLTLSEIIAGERQLPVADTGYLRIRPPVKPVTLGELAGLGDCDPAPDRTGKTVA